MSDPSRLQAGLNIFVSVDKQGLHPSNDEYFVGKGSLGLSRMGRWEEEGGCKQEKIRIIILVIMLSVMITRGILHDTMRSKEMNKLMMLSPVIICFNTLNQIDNLQAMIEDQNPCLCLSFVIVLNLPPLYQIINSQLVITTEERSKVKLGPGSCMTRATKNLTNMLKELEANTQPSIVPIINGVEHSQTPIFSSFPPPARDYTNNDIGGGVKDSILSNSIAPLTVWQIEIKLLTRFCRQFLFEGKEFEKQNEFDGMRTIVPFLSFLFFITSFLQQSRFPPLCHFGQLSILLL